MPGKPAARLTDMHTCPMSTGPVPHVGGPILAPGAPTVLICNAAAGSPAAAGAAAAAAAQSLIAKQNAEREEKERKRKEDAERAAKGLPPKQDGAA